MKYTYSLETFYLDKWVKLFSDTRDFCLGYLVSIRNYSPRLAHRIIRSDGKVMHDAPAVTEVSVGMIASYPTPEQYEFAAAEALKKAAAIRERTARQDAQRTKHFHAS